MFSRLHRWHWVWVMLLALLLAAAAPVEQRAEANGPPNVVANGDFSDGAAHGTAAVGTITVPGSCAAGQAELASGAVLAMMYQNILIKTPPDANDWHLAADMQMVDGAVVEVMTEFYVAENCTEGYMNSTSANGSATTMMTYANSVVQGGVACAQVSVKVFDDHTTVKMCVDNVMLGGNSATLVGLRQMDAQPVRQPVGLGLMGGAAVAALAGVLVALRRVRGR